MQNIRVIGHRGAAAYAPENTIVSFQKAKELGCNFIEFDVVQSKDGELFIFHDKFLQRTSNGYGAFDVSDSNYIKSLDAGRWFSNKYIGTAIPTFKDAISWISQNDMQANIEIKPSHGRVLETTKAILNELKLYWPNAKNLPIISSFNYEVLLLCHKLNPNVPLGILLDKWPKNWLELTQRINCKIINLDKKIANKKIITEIKNNGLEVNVFTVNNGLIARKLYNWGVTAVFSDHPDLLTTGLLSYFKWINKVVAMRFKIIFTPCYNMFYIFTRNTNKL